jgi:uncharacterized membrane protein
VNSALVTQRPGLLVLLIFPTAWAAADASAEPRGILDRGAGWVATAIEGLGIAIIVLGALLATGLFLRQLLRGGIFAQAYRRYREELGRAILLGLELLVAADIIGTVAVDPTFQNLAVLGLIVLIRTFLSFTLEVEIQGRWPWQAGEVSRGAREKDAPPSSP